MLGTNPSTTPTGVTPWLGQDDATLSAVVRKGLKDCNALFEPHLEEEPRIVPVWVRLFSARSITPSQTRAAFDMYLMQGRRFPFPADVLALMKPDAVNSTPSRVC